MGKGQAGGLDVFEVGLFEDAGHVRHVGSRPLHRWLVAGKFDLSSQDITYGSFLKRGELDGLC